MCVSLENHSHICETLNFHHLPTVQPINSNATARQILCADRLRAFIVEFTHESGTGHENNNRLEEQQFTVEYVFDELKRVRNVNKTLDQRRFSMFHAKENYIYLRTFLCV